MQRLTPDALKIVKEVLLQEREQLKETVINNYGNSTNDLIYKGKAQLCSELLARIEEVQKEGRSNYGRASK